MPRVSDAHLAARRQQILEASWRCFARGGFHGTSMQDIFEEAGLSAGAVYRYFPGKLDLMKATAESLWGGIGEVFDRLDAMDPVPEPSRAFEVVIDGVVRVFEHPDVDRSRIVVHVWSEALREPRVGSVVADLGIRIRRRWAHIAARWRAAGYMSADGDADAVARIMYGLMVGFVLQRHALGDVTPEQYVGGFTALLGSRS